MRGGFAVRESPIKARTYLENEGLAVRSWRPDRASLFRREPIR